MSGFKQLAAGMAQKRIESPLAKYNSIGQLSCIICNQVVKSEVLWNAHLNSKTHLTNKSQMKMQLVGQMAKPLSNVQNEPATKKASNVNVATSKRPTETPDVDKTNNKKQKLEGIVKSTNSIDLNKINSDFDAHYKTSEAKPEAPNNTQEAEATTHAVEEGKTQGEVSEAVLALAGSALPEGFFDDPEMDAKARGQSRAENLEAEFEEFKRVIQTEDVKSEIIIERDDDRTIVDRNIEEVDEMIHRWNKIEDLHNKREELKKLRNAKQKAVEQKMEADEESSDEEVDLDNVLSFNLRSKNRF